MRAPTTSRPRARARSRGPLLLRAGTAVALVASAALHVVLATGPLVADGGVTLAGMFVAQAVAASAVAVAVLVTGARLAWAAALAVAAASLVALVLSTYVQVPAVGPFPVLYEPFWYGDKVAAAVAAAVATVLAALGLRRAYSRSR